MTLAQVEEAHRALVAEWAVVQETERRLRRGIAVDGSGVERRISSFEQAVALEELGAERLRVARALSHAKARVREARVASANAELCDLLAGYSELVAAVGSARDRLQDAVGTVIVAAWELREAAEAEGLVARRALAVASAAVEDDVERQRVVADRAQRIPASLDPAGTPGTCVERPAVELAGGAPALDERVWQELVRVALAGREHGSRLAQDGPSWGSIVDGANAPEEG